MVLVHSSLVIENLISYVFLSDDSSLYLKSKPFLLKIVNKTSDAFVLSNKSLQLQNLHIVVKVVIIHISTNFFFNSILSNDKSSLLRFLFTFGRLKPTENILLAQSLWPRSRLRSTSDALLCSVLTVLYPRLVWILDSAVLFWLWALLSGMISRLSSLYLWSTSHCFTSHSSLVFFQMAITRSNSDVLTVLQALMETLAGNAPD